MYAKCTYDDNHLYIFEPSLFYSGSKVTHNHMVVGSAAVVMKCASLFFLEKVT